MSLINYSMLEKNGFYDLGVIDPAISTKEIAEQIGRLIHMPGISLIQKLTPKAIASSQKNSYSGNFGLSSLPLHTDFAYWYIPPRYFILRSVVPSDEVFTQIVHTKKCVSVLGNLIKTALFKPRRKTDNKLFLLRILQDEFFRWDELFLVPDNSDAAEVVAKIKSFKESPEIKSILLNCRGQCLLIDNWKVLHGRSAIPCNGHTRVIERAYLSEIDNVDSKNSSSVVQG